MEYKKLAVDLIEAIVKWEMIRQNRTRIELVDRFSVCPLVVAAGAPDNQHMEVTLPAEPTEPEPTESTSCTLPKSEFCADVPSQSQPSLSAQHESVQAGTLIGTVSGSASEASNGVAEWPPRSLSSSFDEFYTTLFPSPLSTFIQPFPSSFTFEDVAVADIRSKVPPNLVLCCFPCIFDSISRKLISL